MYKINKRSFAFLLFLVMILSISAACAASDTDSLQAANNGTTNIDTLKINDIEEDSLETEPSNEIHSADSHKSGEGYTEFEKEEYEMEEGQNVNVKGTLMFFDDAFYEYDSYWKDMNLNCSYTDGNGVTRSYTVPVKSGAFTFDLGQCDGLIASASPYTLTFSPVNDNLYETFVEENYDRPLANSWVTLTVNESQTLPPTEANTIYVGPEGADQEGYGTSDNPYKTINYAVLNAMNNDIIYIYAGTYDENSIKLNKTLTFIGENRNVIIGSTKTAQGQKVFEDSEKGDSSYKFINLTFKDVSFGSNSLIFNLQNTGTNEIANCTFEGLTLRIIINSLASETKISNCEFENCGINQAMSGAAVYLSGKASIKDTIFANILNKATMSYVNLIQTAASSQLDIDNITISGTTGKYNLINVNKDSVTTIKNSKVINNNVQSQSTAMGGMIFSATGSNLTLNISHSIIANNSLQNGYFYGISDTMNFNMNYNVIYNNTGKIMVNANPKYNLEYNYWGDNNKPDSVDINNWIVVEASHSPDSALPGEEFTVTAELKVKDNAENLNDLEKAIPEVPVTFEYNNQKASKVITDKKAENKFIFDASAEDITITAINERLTDKITEKEFKVYVGPEGVDAEGYGTKDNPYKTINYAVSKADPNYTVYIYEGRYDENSITLNKNLTILGENKNVIITSSRNNVKVFEASYNDNGNHISLRFENLTFDTIKPGQYNAILHLRNDDRNEIVNCVFTNTDNQYNIWSASKETLIENCEFKDITFTSAGYIVYISGPGKHDLINNTFDKISSTAGGVVSLINIMNKPHYISIENISITNVTGKINGVNINNNGNGNVNNSVSIKNAIIEDNELEKTTNNQGGAVFIAAGSTTLTVTNSTIKNNYVARGIFAGTSSETKINANYNILENNDGDIIFSTTAGSPVTNYNVDYNYWGSENPDLGDLKVNAYFTNEDLTEIITIKQPVEPNMEINIDENIHEGENVTVEITLNEDATGTIAISGIEGVNPQTLENGKTTFKIQNLKANQYPITITYSGDENYTSKEYETTITVAEPIQTPEFNVSANNIKENEELDITFTLTNGPTGENIYKWSIFSKSGLLLETGNVTADNKIMTTKTYPAGNYTVQVALTGIEGWNDLTVSDTFEIKALAEIPGIEDMLNPTTPAGSNTPSYTISLPENATGNLTVTVDGNKTYTQALENGKATVTLPELSEGKHNITVTYTGDENYKGVSKNSTINVDNPVQPINQNNTNTQGNSGQTQQNAGKTKKLTPKIIAKKKTFKASKKVKKYTITLKIGKKPLKKVRVTLKIKGKTYKAKTNAKGKATFKIKKLTKKGKYKAIITYKGNKTYNKVTKKVKITIKK